MAAAYFAPSDLDEALDLIQARPMSIVAGGTDFFPARGQAPLGVDLVDVTNVTGLRGITWQPNGWLRIGGATTWTDIVRADLPAAFSGLQAAAREIGSVQIQNTGTVAGNLCNASPAADSVPPLLTLEAEVELASTRGQRHMALTDFLKGPRQTALAADELLVALHIPCPPAHAGSAFEKAGARKYMVISIAMTAVIIGVDQSGHIDVARIAVGSCSPVATRLIGLEMEMIGSSPNAIQVSLDHLALLAPLSDIRADAQYRLEAVQQQIRRAIQSAVSGYG